MTKPLKIVAANDSFGVLVALGEVLAGKQALFVSPPEVNGKLPELHDLPNHVADDVALIVESSGSTGKPKRIELSLDALLASSRASLERIGGPGQWLLALPTNFIAGAQVLVRSLLSESQPVLMNTSVSFSAEGFVRSAGLMTGERKYTSLVPTQLGVLASAMGLAGSGAGDAGADLGADTATITDSQLAHDVLHALVNFDAVLLGGQAPRMPQVKALRDLGVNIVITYGMTETSGGCVYNGVPLDGVRVGLGENGEILIAGPTLANGIGEWFATADAGVMQDGRLMVTGRLDRVINSGGIKLSLDLVEEWVRTQPGAIDAVAHPLQNPKYGDSFICWVVTADEEQIDRQLAVQSLGLAAGTAVWASLPELPLLPSGKPDVQALLQTFIQFQNELREKRARGEI